MAHWKRSDLVKKGLLEADPIIQKKVTIVGDTIILNLRAVPKPRMTRQDKWKKRDVVVRYHQYKDDLRALLPANYILPDSFMILYSFAVSPSWSKNKQFAMIGMPHQQRPDLDNLHKGIMDALLKNDETVWQINGSKRWALTDTIKIVKL